MQVRARGARLAMPCTPQTGGAICTITASTHSQVYDLKEELSQAGRPYNFALPELRERVTALRAEGVAGEGGTVDTASANGGEEAAEGADGGVETAAVTDAPEVVVGKSEGEQGTEQGTSNGAAPPSAPPSAPPPAPAPTAPAPAPALAPALAPAPAPAPAPKVVAAAPVPASTAAKKDDAAKTLAELQALHKSNGGQSGDMHVEVTVKQEKSEEVGGEQGEVQVVGVKLGGHEGGDGKGEDEDEDEGEDEDEEAEIARLEAEEAEEARREAEERRRLQAEEQRRKALKLKQQTEERNVRERTMRDDREAKLQVTQNALCLARHTTTDATPHRATPRTPRQGIRPEDMDKLNSLGRKLEAGLAIGDQDISGVPAPRVSLGFRRCRQS